MKESIGRQGMRNCLKLLEASFKRHNDLLNSVTDAPEIFPVNTGETMEEYLTRLLDHE